MGLARHDPANWVRAIDERIVGAASDVQRQMLATLRKRFMSAFAHDLDGFLSTFAPDFLRVAYVGGSATTSDLNQLREVASLGALTWPELDRLMVDCQTIAIEGSFNVVLADAAQRRTLGVVVADPEAAYLLTAQAALFIEFRGGVQVREIAYGGAAPILVLLNPNDELCRPTAAKGGR